MVIFKIKKKFKIKNRVIGIFRRMSYKKLNSESIVKIQKTLGCKLRNISIKFRLYCKMWSKIEILVKNRNVGQKSKFCAKIKILVKNRIFDEKSKFAEKWKFW